MVVGELKSRRYQMANNNNVPPAANSQSMPLRTVELLHKQTNERTNKKQGRNPKTKREKGNKLFVSRKIWVAGWDQYYKTIFAVIELL